MNIKLRNILEMFIPCVGTSNESTRDDWLEKTLRLIPKNSRILDAGAGTQRYRKLCTHLNYVSQDFGKYDGQGDHAGLHTGSMDYGKIAQEIYRIPYRVSSRYSKDKPKLLEYFAMFIVQKMLLRFSKRDTGFPNSAELLCFGWQVVGRKV